jgi:hypothetical protein
MARTLASAAPASAYDQRETVRPAVACRGWIAGEQMETVAEPRVRDAVCATALSY